MEARKESLNNLADEWRKERDAMLHYQEWKG